jgi:hypothetical protein
MLANAKIRGEQKMRIIIITLLVVGTFLSVFLVINYNMDKRVCERTLEAFRNAVVLFESVQNRYPENLEELQNHASFLGKIDTKRYIWVES